MHQENRLGTRLKVCFICFKLPGQARKREPDRTGAGPQAGRKEAWPGGPGPRPCVPAAGDGAETHSGGSRRPPGPAGTQDDSTAGGRALAGTPGAGMLTGTHPRDLGRQPVQAP